jgi:hypothetical protein
MRANMLLDQVSLCLTVIQIFAQQAQSVRPANLALRLHLAFDQSKAQ